MSGTGGVGSVTVQGKANHTVTGVAGTGSSGAVTVSFEYYATGVAGTGAVGTVSVNQAFAVTGVSATGEVGSDFFVWNRIVPANNEQWTPIFA